jgi:predicted O-methyltransferase YrrM
MEPALAAHLHALADHGAAHDAGLEDRLLRLRNMKPAAAALVAMLVRVHRSATVLEIGTSNGYSAIWLGDAVRAHGGRVVTVETEADRVAEARGNLREAGVAGYVEVRHAAGGDVLAGVGDASVDTVVLDAERPEYVGYWPDVTRVLAPGGFVAVDNAVSHADQVAGFRGLVEADRTFHTALFDVGDGVFVAVREGS